MMMMMMMMMNGYNTPYYIQGALYVTFFIMYTQTLLLLSVS